MSSILNQWGQTIYSSVCIHIMSPVSPHCSHLREPKSSFMRPFHDRSDGLVICCSGIILCKAGKEIKNLLLTSYLFLFHNPQWHMFNSIWQTYHHIFITSRSATSHHCSAYFKFFLAPNTWGNSPWHSRGEHLNDTFNDLVGAGNG